MLTIAPLVARAVAARLTRMAIAMQARVAEVAFAPQAPRRGRVTTHIQERSIAVFAAASTWAAWLVGRAVMAAGLMMLLPPPLATEGSQAQALAEVAAPLTQERVEQAAQEVLA
jgi:hypothetical protein